MAQISKLAAILNGLIQNVDLSTYDLVTSSVYVGGGSRSEEHTSELQSH